MSTKKAAVKGKSKPAPQSRSDKFKAAAKKAAAQSGTPRTQLIPQTEWQSTENLDMRGDLAEAFEVELVKAYEALQRAGQAFQQFMSLNMQTGKIKISYIWNTGEIPTEKEVAEYKEALAYVQQERQKQIETLQGNIEKGLEANKTGLVTAGGQPLTEANLDEEKISLIIQP